MCTKGAPCSGFPRNLGLVQKRKKSSPDILKKHPKTFTDLMNFSEVGGVKGVNVIDVGLY